MLAVIALGTARLIMAPFLLAFFLVVGVMLTLAGGVMWIATGRARVWFSWPVIIPRRRYWR